MLRQGRRGRELRSWLLAGHSVPTQPFLWTHRATEICVFLLPIRPPILGTRAPLL